MQQQLAQSYGPVPQSYGPAPQAYPQPYVQQPYVQQPYVQPMQQPAQSNGGLKLWHVLAVVFIILVVWQWSFLYNSIELALKDPSEENPFEISVSASVPLSPPLDSEQPTAPVNMNTATYTGQPSGSQMPDPGEPVYESAPFPAVDISLMSPPAAVPVVNVPIPAVTVPAPLPAPVVMPVVSSTPKVSSLVGKFSADDYLNINVNGVQVYGNNNIGWSDYHHVNLANIKSGDKVSFIVRNGGGPGGFIGTFVWNGKTYNVNADLFPGNQTIEGAGAWGQNMLDQYPTSARWLWKKDNCDICTHVFDWVAPL